MEISLEMNVLFDDPFWVGIFYLRELDEVRVCRVVFGQEPSDGQVYEYFLMNFQHLKFDARYQDKVVTKVKNPKRMQRQIKKQSLTLYSGTKSMQALKKQYEQTKIQNKQLKHQSDVLKKEHLFALKQQKRKAKHRGH